METGTTTIDAPAESTFKPMGDFMIRRCGTLDCHGQIGRNLRLYGEWGMRLASSDVPGQSPTTAAEYEADYETVIGLEPEILSQVVMQGGSNPTRLRLFSKPMGLLEHKGGTLIPENPSVVLTNDPQYTCIVSWLSQSVNTMACQTATLMIMP